MSVEKHRRESERVEVRFCVIVASDRVARGAAEDEVIPLVAELLSRRGLSLESSVVVPNEGAAISSALLESLSSCDAVVVAGGTGLGPRDISVDVIRGMCTKDLPGFGELFRFLTYRRHGAAALATRATACAVGDRLVFITPGSPDAVRLALEELILPEVRHLVAELRGLRA